MKIEVLKNRLVKEGLRRDLDRLDNDTVTALVSSLKRRGVSESVIMEALNEAVHD